MATKTRCTRCKAVMAHKEWNEHECKGMPKLNKLPFDLLRKVAYGTITEAQAWKLAAVRGVT